ncbi:MAG: hypothetical protein LC122_13035 [Chitinophagales bacterium]|nr:hypothetical protein [Chitinophagales bacterium]
MNKLSDEQIKEIIKLYKSGETPKEIGEAFNIYSNSVTRLLKRNGVERTQLIRLTEEQEKYILEKYNSGISSEDIAKEMNIVGSTVTRAIKRQGGKIRPATENKRKYKINMDYFEKIDTEEKAYFLGFLYSDGHIHSNDNTVTITLKDNDVEILKKFSNIIYGFEKLYEQKRKLKDGTEARYISLSFQGEKIHSDLIKLGCTPVKSHTITFPTFLADNLYRHFIRGVLDGDGCIYTPSKPGLNPCVDITSNEFFLKGLSEHVKNTINVICGIYGRKDKKSKGLQITGKFKIKKFLDYIYKDSTIYLQRKFDKYQEFLKKAHELDINNYGTTYISEMNGIQLTNKNIKNPSLNLDLNNVTEYLFNFYRTNGFPYPKYSDDDLIKDFYLLKKLDINTIKNDKIFSPVNYSGLNIFRHFSEQFFEVKSGYDNKPSMVEGFNDDKILLNTIRNRIAGDHTICGNMIRQGLANSFNVFKASTFNPGIAKAIYQMYAKDGDIIYDYSMGFGQRMLAALALPFSVKYIGVDPMERTIANNCEMFNHMKEICPNIKNEVDMVLCGSEEYFPEELKGKVNLAFSSPPYYKLEIYEENLSQANSDSYCNFINIWWKKTCENINNLLTDDGIFLLNMAEEVDGFFILEDMCEIIKRNNFKEIDRYFIKLNKNNSFHGGKEKLEPIIVFKRI